METLQQRQTPNSSANTTANGAASAAAANGDLPTTSQNNKTSDSSPASLESSSRQPKDNENVIPTKKKRTCNNNTVLLRKFLQRALKFYSCLNTSNVNYLKYKKLKLVFFVIFVAYFVFNFTITITRLKINFPMVDLLPQQSYLTKHMHNHVNLFKLGPVVILNFIRPMRYWENATFTRITNMVHDMKQIPGISGFELNWLRDVYATKSNSFSQEWKPECQTSAETSNPFTCFTHVLAEFLGSAQNRDDCMFNFQFRNASVASKSNPDPILKLEKVRYPDELMIKGSRIYLQMKDFKGVRSEPELIDNLRDLAQYKYNFTKESLIIFTSVGLFLEQLEEIYPTIISMFLLTFEVIYFRGYFFNSTHLAYMLG
jgi:hypothetical protein